MNNSIRKLDNLTDKEKRAVGDLVSGLEKLYGDNLSRVILYGSKARGDSGPESDLDILAVLKEMGTGYDEIKKINKLVSPICLKYGVPLSVIPFEQKRYDDTYKTIFVHNVDKEGTEILS